MTTLTTLPERRRVATIVGALFIASTVAGSLNAGIAGPIIRDATDPARVTARACLISVGALLDLICAGTFVAISVTVYPVLREHSPVAALSYVVARCFEAVPFVIGVVSVMTLLSLSQQASLFGELAAVETAASLLKATYYWSQVIGPRMLCGLAGLPFYRTLHRGRLVPRFLSIWGLAGAAGILAAGVLGIVGLRTSTVASVLLTVPLALNEMVLAVWLVSKGFQAQRPA